jgi:general stress protein 26
MYDAHDQTAQGQDKLTELIKDIRFGMFTTHKIQGHLHSRPMTTQNKRIDDDSLWFFMSRSGDPVSEFQGDDQVNVSYGNPGSDTYVSVSGTAHVVDDPAKKQALWNTAAAAWFKGGVDDPDLALVQVRIVHADYWDVKESKLVQLYRMAEASLTGKQPKLGEHGHIRPH